MELPTIWYLLIGLLGLVFGSFFNVAIYRWPLEDKKQREWVITPSRCPKCGKPIRWYDNVPLLSYIVLRGRCRDCKTPIHWRYPAVELGTALLWLTTAWLVTHVGLTGLALAEQTGWHLALAIVFTSFYFLTVIIDFETTTIPHEISYGHFIAAILFLVVCSGHTISAGWLASLIGMAALAAFYFIFFYFGAMGDGDVHLALGIGFLFGWPLVVEQGFLSIFLGGIPATFMMVYLIAKRKYQFGKNIIPFGPFIGVAAFVSLFWGKEITNWYLQLFLHGGSHGFAIPAGAGLI